MQELTIERELFESILKSVVYAPYCIRSQLQTVGERSLPQAKFYLVVTCPATSNSNQLLVVCDQSFAREDAGLLFSNKTFRRPKICKYVKC